MEWANNSKVVVVVVGEKEMMMMLTGSPDTGRRYNVENNITTDNRRSKLVPDQMRTE